VTSLSWSGDIATGDAGQALPHRHRLDDGRLGTYAVTFVSLTASHAQTLSAAPSHVICL
jgi:hypothetical protein